MKKTNSSSTKRRMKKSVRKTVGGLFMASAIIVAAIPFPDSYAYDTATAEIPAYVQPTTYNTNFNDSRHNFASNENFSTYPNRSAYNVMQTSAGTWLLDRQFDYAMTTNGGYITDYNDLYPTDNISLSNEVYYDYAYLTQADVEKFYNESANRYIDVELHYGESASENKTVESLRFNYVLDGAYSDTDVIHLWLNEHFPNEVAKYRTEYTDYLANVGTPEEINHPKPDAIIKTNADYYKTDAERIVFLCGEVFGDGTPAVSLVSAVNQELQRTGVDGKVFLPNVGSTFGSHSVSIDGHTYWVDDDGFLCESQDQIIGIGAGAFADVKNVNTLDMAPEITFIGDGAFERSFITAATLPNGALVGNRAFADCTRLTNADISGVVKVFDETFKGSAINEVTIPEACSYVGVGAFADCENLKTVNFDPSGAVGQTSKEICDYAFYNDSSLETLNFNNAKITSIGKAAFAIPSGSSDKLKDLLLPSTITTTGTKENIGEYAFAGRDSLEYVTFPSGINGEIDDTILYNCRNLESVTFDDNCVNASYDSTANKNDPNTMFYTVTNPNFYVRGPKQISAFEAANPRKSTWRALYDYAATGNVGRHVPYVYNENGKDYYEVSDGNYLMVIEKDTGELISCSFPDTPTDINEFRIPAVVGLTTVTGIKEGCFVGDSTNTGVLDYIINLVIEDGSNIDHLDDNTFAGADKMETAYLGDSVSTIGNGAFENCPRLSEVTFSPTITSIGDEAFQNCPKLENITFESPSDLSAFPDGNIGTDAFNTGGTKLTIHGEIGNGYAPFEWATNTENYANKSQSIRTLYKTPAPTSLSVILDNQNDLATLVDYPHYEYLDRVAYDANKGRLVELDTAPSSGDPYYGQTIMDKLNNGDSLNYWEETMVQNCSNLVIPEGIESIDVKGFFNDTSDNPNKVASYSNKASATAYFNKGMTPYNTYSTEGLFRGYYGNETGTEGPREYDPTSSLENVDRGNDRLTSVTMYDVVYLPDNAFESCENLQTAYLGDDIEDVGVRPFAGCTKISSVACGNDNFVCNNGVLYENTTNGKKIIEGLETRGSIVGSGTVNISNDPDLANVTEIAEGAFTDCTYLRAADFTGVDGIDEIPEDCFSGCYNLTEVDVPSNVTEIGEEAFATGGDYLKATVRNKNLYLGDDSNGPTGDKVKTAYYVTYEDAPSRKIAKKQGYIVDQTLDDVWTVKFYDQTGTNLLYTEHVQNGKNAEGPDESLIPVIPGYTFTGWNQSLKNITSDCFRLAVYTAEGSLTPGVVSPTPTNAPSGTTPGTTPGGTTPGTTPGSATPTPKTSPTPTAKQYNLQVIYGSGSGSYAADTTVIIEAIDAPAGKVFDKWVTSGNSTPTIYSTTSKATTLKMPAGDCIVTATYKDSTGNSSRQSTSVSTRTGTTGTGTVPNRNTGTVVDISKPGISNVDKAYASVSGSTDNFIVKITESNEAANEVATALSQKYGDMTPIKYFAMDISLYDATGTNKITNVNGLSVNITMPIPDALKQYAGNNRVGAVNGMTLEELPCKFVTVDGIPCVSFTATHFSPYTIYVDTSNLTYGTIDSTPKTGDGIHPKWFVSIALFSLSLILFLKKDKVVKVPKTA